MLINSVIRCFHLRILAGLLLLSGLALPLAPQLAQAQPATFGSADAPSEQLQTVWWKRENSLDVLGGLSLIGPQWLVASRVRLNIITRPITAHLGATLRAGYYGNYVGRDLNEPYDALRLIEFIRYAPPGSPLYARIGPIQRMRLGTGHLVNFFNSAVAWDDRTVGAEALLQSPYGDLAFFTDNLLLDGVTGARLTLHPLRQVTANPMLGSLKLGGAAVTDLATWRASGIEPLTGYNVDAQFALLQAGSINLSPFASFASYLRYGSGVGLGVDAQSGNFIDLARFQLRLAYYYSSEQFIPGYFDSFYSVSNFRSRILNSEGLSREQASNPRVGSGAHQFEGILLEDITGGSDVLTELRLLIFERFEFWYAFRRHFGSQELSAYHLRLFFRSPGRFRLGVGQDRAGLGGFFSLFNSLGDQTALVFDAEYHVGNNFWAHVRSRYTYEHIREDENNVDQYLVQRRFEPLAGFRFIF